MTRYLKSFISLLLIVVCLAAGFTDAFTKAVAEAIQEQAEQNKLAANARPVTETLESNGWQYRVCADGYAELLGYTDTSADTLTLPTALGGDMGCSHCQKWICRECVPDGRVYSRADQRNSQHGIPRQFHPDRSCVQRNGRAAVCPEAWTRAEESIEI